MRLQRCFRYPCLAVVVLCLVLGVVVGCAPQRMAISDPDDLAQFAAASQASAEKQAEKQAELRAAQGADKQIAATKALQTNSFEAKSKSAAAQVAKKPELDPPSRAYLDRIAKEQNFDAVKIAEFEELLSNLPPEIRTPWVAGEEAKANKSKPPVAGSAVAPPRELPPVVNARPMTPKQYETQQADYQQPAQNASAAPVDRDANSLANPSANHPANSELITEFRAVNEKLAQVLKMQQERDAASLAREQAQEETDRIKMGLDALSRQGSMNSFASSDEGGGSLSGLSTNFGQAEIAALMAKSHARTSAIKSDKKAPLPGDSLSKTKLDSPVSLTTPASAGANLEQIWNQIAGAPSDDPSLNLALRKKLFLLAAGNVDAASTPPESLPPSQKEFWKHCMRMLELSMKLGDHPRPDRQAALVGRELREAAAELESASVLDIQNATFCSRVHSFGNYVEFESRTFKPNEEVILYVEIQNFVSKQSADGKAFETSLHGSYQILDASGKRVADHDLPPENGACRQRRRDYFLAYPIHLPKNVSEGDYTLQIMMEDKNSGKFGQSMLKFAIQK